MHQPTLLAELADVIRRAKFARRLHDAGISAEALIHDYARLAEIVDAPALPQPVCRDPDDNYVFACGLGSGADVIGYQGNCDPDRCPGARTHNGLTGGEPMDQLLGEF